MLVNRMSVDIWTVKAILMRYQTEMRSMLLDNREKAILVMDWQRMCLNCVCVLVFHEI